MLYLWKSNIIGTILLLKELAEVNDITVGG